VNCRKVPRQQCSPVCKPTYYCEVCQENDSYGAPQAPVVDTYGSPQAAPVNTYG
jgi:hypothetical protein